MRKLTMLLLAALAACAAAPAPIPDVAAQPADCSLTVRFGSYAMGIDREAATRIEALLAAERGSAVTRHGWGREGEYDLCVKTRSQAEAETLLARIRAHPRRPTRADPCLARRWQLGCKASVSIDRPARLEQ